MSKRSRILAIEDDPDLGYLYQSFLEAEGYDVEVARDAAEAALRLRDLPDLVLLDLMLPGIDGYTILRRMKADRSIRDIPVIVVSATVPPGRQHIPGADALIRKPFEFDGLLRAIEVASHHAHVTH